MAAPFTPRAGAPRLPKMNTQLKKTLTKKVTMDKYMATLTVSTHRMDAINTWVTQKKMYV